MTRGVGLLGKSWTGSEGCKLFLGRALLGVLGVDVASGRTGLCIVLIVNIELHEKFCGSAWSIDVENCLGCFN